MNAPSISALLLAMLVPVATCNAQLSVNADWKERNGITVASSQTVAALVSKLRGFTTLSTTASEPRAAVQQLKLMKNAAVLALSESGVARNTVQTTSTQLSDSTAIVVKSVGLSALTRSPDAEEFYASCHLSFEVTRAGARARRVVAATI